MAEIRRTSCIVFALLTLTCLDGAGAELTTEEIVQRAVTRAQWAHRLNRQTNYTYEKTTIVEEIDGKGHIRERKEKMTRFESGVGTLLGLKINDKPVEIRDKQKGEAFADRQHITRGSSPAKRDDDWTNYLTKDLTSRYNFEVVGHESVDGRDSYVLSFKPASNKLPIKRITDRLINHLGGKIWVDKREFEVTRADIRLLEEVSMWGGVLGAMKKFAFKVERQRLDSDAWFNRTTNMELEGRKLFDATRLRIQSESSNHRRTVAINRK
ncbi:MAG: hypothetical protein L0Y58_20805 [Verrucomicrobia subdivision 3 bacterium]|nr:hypothetical protein [Limisphaerales bacterium]